MHIFWFPWLDIYMICLLSAIILREQINQAGLKILIDPFKNTEMGDYVVRSLIVLCRNDKYAWSRILRENQMI